MKVRCGACRSELDVPGPGRFSCPACGAVNQVGAAGPMEAHPMGPSGGLSDPSPPPPSSPPSPPPPRVTCGSCGFEFFVGPIETARCPNCTAEVAIPKVEP